jgi:AraC-like DNA-binding protein
MNQNEIKAVLKDLYKISGFRVSLHGIHYEEIAAYPEKKLPFCSYVQAHGEGELEKCRNCDAAACKKAMAMGDTVIYKCHHGLVEAISPLYNFGALTGYVIMGQVRESGTGIHAMVSALKAMGKNDEEGKNLSLEIPTIESGLISAFANITTICAKYLTISNAFVGDKLTVGQNIMKYLSENYTQHISITDICNHVGYSKSTVLSSFKREFGTTVNSKLCEIRLNAAKKLLEESEITINEIALCTGFADQSYFSKVFSAKYGITPSEYRKEQ